MWMNEQRRKKPLCGLYFNKTLNFFVCLKKMRFLTKDIIVGRIYYDAEIVRLVPFSVFLFPSPTLETTTHLLDAAFHSYGTHILSKTSCRINHHL